MLSHEDIWLINATLDTMKEAQADGKTLTKSQLEGAIEDLEKALGSYEWKSFV